MRPLLCLALALTLAASSCGGDAREEILVFAAASLSDVVEPLSQRFGDSEGIKVSFNLGGSSALAQQIVRGVPADLFISAGTRPMDILEERGLILSGTWAPLLVNELVLVGRSGSQKSSGLTDVQGLASADLRVAIADPELAPAGEYAKEALENLGLWRLLQPRLVPAPDVRTALSYVETGNVDAGIVYRTDVHVARGVEILATLPEDSHSPIVYPVALVSRSGHSRAALKFLEYLQRDEGKETFRSYGFVPHGGD